jgi:glycosyltransferase involved in cell wall biosynthesis
MKRIIFLNRFFYPDHSATSQILTDLAFYAASSGRQVHVITSQQRYNDPAARLADEETVQGVQVHRIATTRFGRTALLGRSFDYFSFYSAMWRELGLIGKTGDIVVAKTDPPLLSVIARYAAGNSQLVNWLQDLYPEVAIELGVPFIKGPIGRGLSYLRDATLKAAVANVVVGDKMAAKVRSLGVDRIHVIPNWTDDEKIVPVRHEDNSLRSEWGLEDKFVVGYSGNLGRAHEYETVLGAAERLRDHPRIVFAFIGGGHQFDDLARSVKRRGLEKTFRFFAYQDRTLLKYTLGVADVHWISLKPALEGLIVPSKFYGIAAAGRPIIAVMHEDGEIARLVKQHACGLVVAPGDLDSLTAALLTLTDDPGRIADMGTRARAMLDAHFTRVQAFQRWRQLLDAIV